MHWTFKLIFILSASIPTLDHAPVEVGQFEKMADCYYAAQHMVYDKSDSPNGNIRTAFCVPERVK